MAKYSDVMCVYVYVCVQQTQTQIQIQIQTKTRYRINYVFIFEFDPRTKLTHYQIIDEAATLTILYLINVITYAYTAQIVAAEYAIVLPAAMLVFVILKLFMPFFDYWHSRKSLIQTLFQIIIAPFGRVRFRDFFAAGI